LNGSDSRTAFEYMSARITDLYTPIETSHFQDVVVLPLVGYLFVLSWLRCWLMLWERTTMGVFAKDAQEDTQMHVFLWKTRRKTHKHLCFCERRRKNKKNCFSINFFSESESFTRTLCVLCLLLSLSQKHMWICVLLGVFRKGARRINWFVACQDNVYLRHRKIQHEHSGPRHVCIFWCCVVAFSGRCVLTRSPLSKWNADQAVWDIWLKQADFLKYFHCGLIFVYQRIDVEGESRLSRLAKQKCILRVKALAHYNQLVCWSDTAVQKKVLLFDMTFLPPPPSSTMLMSDCSLTRTLRKTNASRQHCIPGGAGEAAIEQLAFDLLCKNNTFFWTGVLYHSPHKIEWQRLMNSVQLSVGTDHTFLYTNRDVTFSGRCCSAVSRITVRAQFIAWQTYALRTHNYGCFCERRPGRLTNVCVFVKDAEEDAQTLGFLWKTQKE